MPKTPATNTNTRLTRATSRPSPTKPDKRARKKAQCTICEGRPLRSECEHTAAGRLYLFTLRNTVPEPNPPAVSLDSGPIRLPTPTEAGKSPEKAPGRCSKCTGRPLRAQCCHTKSGRLFIHEQSILDELNQQSVLEQGPSTPVNNSHTSPLRFTPFSDSVIDPALRAEDTVRHIPEPSASGIHRSPSPSQGHGTPPAVALNSNTKRSRPSAANPSFGHVEGVYRGEAAHSIHRGHALPRRINDRDKCQKQFLETANSIITRCEDLSAQTGCWLFVGIQHATAHGAPIHYASPRIRRDAPDAISDFASEFCTMMNDVMDVCRRDTFEVQQNLHAMQLEKEQLEKELASLRSKDIDREASLNAYKDLFGSLSNRLA